MIANSQHLPPDIMAKLCLYLIFVFSFLLILFYGYIIVLQLKKYMNERKQKDGELELFKAIPSFIHFRRRIDHFIVLKNGDGRLNWTFDIEKNTENPISYMNIPILCEHLRGEMNPSVKSIIIEKLMVNNDVYDVTYLPQFIRYPFNENISSCRPTEIGCIRTPVNLPKGKSKASIKFTLLLKNVFSEAEIKEFVVVDIPYITEKLTVVVTHESDSCKIIPVYNNGHLIDAYSDHNLNIDMDEVAEQNKNIKSSNGTIVWKTGLPKLGYSYQINFQVKSGGE
ncbi:MAG: hypothetical protein JL50_04490 [Peptococcaceae bacterium BICA1-7]|nr:MAG: hypothetical protein JL50_04490 [Peptococcaceae bacterium BICA1-7]HBV95881.1 hypothetical protein [Desulfotomaculum sp.]